LGLKWWPAPPTTTSPTGRHSNSETLSVRICFRVNTEEDFKEKVLNNLTRENETFPRDTLLYTYSGIILAVLVFGVVHGLYFMIFFAVASSNLHRLSFSNIIKATMRFFNGNPSGRILNRFSRDLGSIDEYIPAIVYDVIAVSCHNVVLGHTPRTVLAGGFRLVRGYNTVGSG
jgi:ABC-type multidrug transport system fused ATPase/permease subunit